MQTTLLAAANRHGEMQLGIIHEVHMRFTDNPALFHRISEVRIPQKCLSIFQRIPSIDYRNNVWIVDIPKNLRRYFATCLTHGNSRIENCFPVVEISDFMANQYSNAH